MRGLRKKGHSFIERWYSGGLPDSIEGSFEI